MSNPPFVFSLERVREVRAHEEDLAREAFAASLSLRARGIALLADAQHLGIDVYTSAGVLVTLALIQGVVNTFVVFLARVVAEAP